MYNILQRVKFKKTVTYIVLISLITPFLVGVLLIEPAMAAGEEDHKSLLKGLLMMLLLSFVVDDDSGDSTDYSDAEIPEPGIGQDTGEYVRFQPKPGGLRTLAKAIHSEARGEDYIGQVAVAAVILNRVDSSYFPNTIDGVVYQKVDGAYAFSAVLDGQIDLEPSQNSYQVARDALNGWDPTQGALYYYNPETATASWVFENTEPIKRIGEHVFARRKV